MKIKYTALAAASLMFLFGQQAQAGLTITWGGTADAIGLASDATSGWDSSYEFLLGTMGSGFNPADPNTYVSSFTTLSTATYTSNGFPNEGYFAGVYTIADNSVLAADTPLYMWVRKGTATVSGTEWLLVTDNDQGTGGWRIPVIQQNQEDRAISFSLVCDGSNAHQLIFGGIGGSVNQQVGGVFTAPPTGNPSRWCYQTHTFPIPEPTAATLGLLGLFGMLRRRRR